MKKIKDEKIENLDPMAQAFMKFCEEELNVTFVDVEVEEQEIDELNKKSED